MDHCQECGAPGERHELIPTDVGTIHRGECHMRFVANLETIDLEKRLWAAVSLWDMNRSILVNLVLPPAPGNRTKRSRLGVLVDHVPPAGDEPEAWVLEDQTGKRHFIPVVLEMTVAEDAFAA
jgi:hypothetical protein